MSRVIPWVYSKLTADQILTGATGSLGAHILSLLLNQPSVSKVYCLIRGANPLLRLQKSFKEKELPLLNSSKFHILTSNLSEPHLGLSDADYQNLRSSATHIIHCAWPVNFQLGLPSFIPSLQGLQRLIQLSLSTNLPTPARLIFCSSIFAALGTTTPARIPEAPIHSLEQVSYTGYGASKLVGERIVQAAVERYGAKATILRIGQAVGDTKAGIWNDTEAFPLIIRSALTMGILPEIEMACKWLPVDTLAQAILEILQLNHGRVGTMPPSADIESKEQLVYNILSPHTFSWSRDLCPTLHETALPAFETVPFDEWLARLRTLSATAGTADEAADPYRNPAIKLIDVFASDFAGNKIHTEVVFETEKAIERSPALRDAPKVIESSLLEKIVERWVEKWGKETVLE